MHEIPELDRKGLRQFGLMFAGFMGAVFGLLLPWVWGWNYPMWPWAMSAGFVLWSLIAPSSINPFYRLWMRLGMAIGTVVTFVLLGAVFFGMVLPMGLFMRLRGWDPMKRKVDAGASSYRITSKPIPQKNMEKPF